MKTKPTVRIRGTPLSSKPHSIVSHFRLLDPDSTHSQARVSTLSVQAAKLQVSSVRVCAIHARARSRPTENTARSRRSRPASSVARVARQLLAPQLTRHKQPAKKEQRGSRALTRAWSRRAPRIGCSVAPLRVAPFSVRRRARAQPQCVRLGRKRKSINSQSS